MQVKNQAQSQKEKRPDFEHEPTQHAASKPPKPFKTPQCYISSSNEKKG
jgi:hypothetical protein